MNATGGEWWEWWEWMRRGRTDGKLPTVIWI
jgi:hypothetical protein